MNATTIDIGQLLESNPEIHGGAVVIAGTRITVQSIGLLHVDQGWSAEEIVAENPQISLASVHAALALYFERRPQMEGIYEADLAYADEQIAAQERSWLTPDGSDRPGNSPSSKPFGSPGN